MTDARVTQASVEQFASANPGGMVTQIGLEMWATTATVTGQALVTQIALEQWVPLVMSFSIVGNELRVENPKVGTWPVTVRVTDDDGATFDKVFTITIT